MARRSVRCVVLRDESILMVRLAVGSLNWWTLPGGGVEPGELDEAAALRELQEETQLSGRATEWLCDLPEACFLVEVDDQAEPRLAMDPDLPDAAEIVEVGWRNLSEVAADPQVRQVIAALDGRVGPR